MRVTGIQLFKTLICHCPIPSYREAALFCFNDIILFAVFVFPIPGGSLVSPECQTSLMGVASLLGLEVEELRRSLVSRVMTTTKGGAVGTIIQ